jgi:hypothetical protein
MHLQVRSKVTESGGSSLGAMAASDAATGITRTGPGRLVRLLELLAQDRSQDSSDGHGPFNLVVAAGSGIETTGTFVFAVETPPGASEREEREEHDRAVARISDEFAESWIVERLHEEIPNREGALRDYLKTISDRGYLIDEIVVGVAEPRPGASGAGGEFVVPVQVSVIDAR